MLVEVWVRDRALELTELDYADIENFIHEKLSQYFVSGDYSVEES